MPRLLNTAPLHRTWQHLSDPIRFDPIRLHPIPSHPIPSVPSHPVPSRPIPSLIPHASSLIPHPASRIPHPASRIPHPPFHTRLSLQTPSSIQTPPAFHTPTLNPTPPLSPYRIAPIPTQACSAATPVPWLRCSASSASAAAGPCTPAHATCRSSCTTPLEASHRPGFEPSAWYLVGYGRIPSSRVNPVSVCDCVHITMSRVWTLRGGVSDTLELDTGSQRRDGPPSG